ncbi:exopolysaccharide biosynthesis protein [Phycisphaerales bacterium AB-hyl4]|uniref:Exopolysaccharide biosynthesis protein n=1 Tax=Natronomicrosphaera hydrolytica TaxID=3242702 RepID=A0ABV4U2T4_9BACT
MSNHSDAESLEQLLAQLADADDDEQTISVEQVLDAVGRRSFGPVLLVPGLIALSPVSGIPGAPTVVGIMVLLITGQFLLGRSEFWLPQFLLRRSVTQSRYEKALKVLRPVARFVDRLVKPRLRWLAEGAAVYVIALVCLLLALTAPLLEAVPFAITGVGAAITAFGLSMLANDGLLALLAAGFCVATAFVTSTVLF